MIKKLFILTLAGMLALASTLILNAQVDLNYGLKARYPLDGNANDASGNSNNATPTSISYTTDRFGNTSSACTFDGISSFLTISLTGLDIFKPTDSFSFSFWEYKSENSSPYYDDYFFKGTGTILDFSFYTDPNEYLGIHANGNRIYTDDSTNSLNNWIHFVLIYESSNWKLYKNAVLYATVNGIISNTASSKILLGKGWDGTLPGGFTGKMDEVRIYNRALNQCEINELYAPFTAQPVMSTISGAASSLCKNTFYTLGVTSVAGQTYKWEVSNDLASPQTGNLATFKWSNPGPYTITVTAFNSCSVAGVRLLYPVTITNVSGLVLTISGTNSLCVSTTGLYTANPTTGDNYEWTLISGSTSTLGVGQIGYIAGFQFITPGVNYIKVRAHSSCGWGDYTIYPVTVNGLISNFSISGLSNVCPNSNSQYTITGVTPSSSVDRFYWVVNEGIHTDFLNPISTNILVYFPDNQGGVYLISVVGLNVCGAGYAATKTVTIASGITKPSLTCVGTACSQLTVNTPPAGTSICWYVGSGSCTFSGQTLINRTRDVQTRVEFTNTVTGCSYNAYYFPGCNDGAARIEESSMTFAQNANPEAFKLYPNPNEGNFTFESNGSKGEAFVLNTLGQIIQKIELLEGKYAYSLSVPGKSTYLLRIRTETANKNIKFIVE